MTRNFAFPGRSPIHAQNAAVATSHGMATTSAMTILKEGGNAVDAAIAAAAVLCVVEPHMTGIGGDCFAIVGEPDGTLHGLNGSGRSPAEMSLELLLDQGMTSIPVQSPHAITAPGAVKAWETLHQKFGTMDFARLFADAISYAEQGMVVAQRVASDWAGLVEKLSANAGATKHYLDNGTAPQTGSVWKVPALGKTLRKIAEGGSDAFYQGEIAGDIVKTVRNAGGLLSEDDLSAVSADWVELISTDYRDHTLYEIPPNGQGLAALTIVKLLDKLGPASDDPASLARAHLEMECGRIGYAARDAHLSDPETMAYSVETLLSDSHIDALSRLFDPTRHNNDIALPDPAGSDTVYLSIVDRDGMAVSFINSLFSGFGSGIVTEKTGISLQNRGSGFNLIPGHANAIGPSKRPLHTIIPAMVKKGNAVTHSFGVMGGPYQAMGHAHVLSNMLDYGMDPQQALDDPRIFWDAEGTLELEDGYAPDIKSGLEKLGHACRSGIVHGGGQIIRLDQESGILTAGSDPRKDGHAAGW